MKIITSNNLDQGCENLQKLRTYKPFEYSGKWFLGFWNGKTYAYRSMKSLINKARKDGLTTLETIEIGR